MFHFPALYHRARGPVDIFAVIEHHVKSALKRAGLPGERRLYDLWHTHATLLLLAGEHPEIASERLGHSSIQSTLDTYSHVLPTMQKGTAATLDALLFSEQDATGLPAYN